MTGPKYGYIEAQGTGCACFVEFALASTKLSTRQTGEYKFALASMK